MDSVRTRMQAARSQLKTFHGKPCKFGHGVLRYTTSGQCVECTKASGARYAEKIRRLVREGAV